MPLALTNVLCLAFGPPVFVATVLAGALVRHAEYRPWLLHAWLVSRPQWRAAAVERIPSRGLPSLEALACVVLAAIVLAPVALLVAWAALFFLRVVPPQFGA
jgi:hypothetical protein